MTEQEIYYLPLGVLEREDTGFAVSVVRIVAHAGLTRVVVVGAGG